MGKKGSLSINLYVFFIFIAGLAVFTYILLEYRSISLLGVVLFGLLAFIAENLSVPLLGTGSISVSFIIAIVSLIIFGPPTAVIVAFISFFNIREFTKKIPYYKHIFNLGQYLLSVGIGSIVFEKIYDRTVTNFFDAKNIFFIFLTVYIFFFLNTFSTAGAISINERKNFLNIWVYNYGWLILFQILLAAMSIFIAFLYKLYGPLTIMLTSVPLIIAQYVYLLRVKERRALIGSIMQIVKIIDAKDAYTAGHSARVTEYSEKIARRIGLNEYEIDILKNLANLHDIGKIQIDLSILNKPGKLNDSDWEEIKKHPRVGYDIVKEITFLKKYAKAILYHHEHIDGEGYPDRIKGDKIPLFAKIISVADAYDAMTSDRPYRKALTKDEALAELKKYSGKNFDEKISSIMIEIIKEENEEKNEPI